MSKETRPNEARRGFEKAKTPTKPRYSFQNEHLHRADLGYDDGFRKVRIIEYPASNPQLSVIRDHFAREGLLLGSKVQPEDKRYDRFMIPRAARPITHDSRVRKAGPLTYDDSMLFYDLGKMLREVARFDPSVYEMKAPISQHIAVLEYTKEDEPKIQFVPGFEQALRPSMQGHEAVLHRYVGSLFGEFGDRFQPHIEAFAEGFDE